MSYRLLQIIKDNWDKGCDALNEALKSAVVPAHKFETLVEHCKNQEEQLVQAWYQIRKLSTYHKGEAWFWQEDSNHLESLANDVPVVIAAAEFRRVIANRGDGPQPILYNEEGGRILLDTAQAPFDGKPVLIKLGLGWVEARWMEWEPSVTLDGVDEGDGFCWIVLDDSADSAELDSAEYWMELPVCPPKVEPPHILFK